MFSKFHVTCRHMEDMEEKIGDTDMCQISFVTEVFFKLLQLLSTNLKCLKTRSLFSVSLMFPEIKK